MATCNIDSESTNVQAQKNDVPKTPHDTLYDDVELDNYISDEIINIHISSSWYDNVIDFYNTYGELLKQHTELQDDLKKTVEYIEGVKVPYNYEYARLIFQDIMSDLLGECEDIGFMMSSFPNEIRYHREMVLAHESDNLTKSSTDYLQSILELYAHRIDVLKEDHDHRKKHGQSVLEDSKLIERPCGF